MPAPPLALLVAVGRILWLAAQSLGGGGGGGGLGLVGVEIPPSPCAAPHTLKLHLLTAGGNSCRDSVLGPWERLPVQGASSAGGGGQKAAARKHPRGTREGSWTAHLPVQEDCFQSLGSHPADAGRASRLPLHRSTTFLPCLLLPARAPMGPGRVRGVTFGFQSSCHTWPGSGFL